MPKRSTYASNVLNSEGLSDTVTHASNVSKSGGLSDTDKLMYLAYRAEMIAIHNVELMYDYYWKDHIHFMMNPGRSCALTLIYDEQEEDMRSSEIERLVKRKRLADAFDCAIGS